MPDLLGESATSLTKGCFVHRPQEKGKKLTALVTKYNNEQFTSIWEKTEEKIKSIEKKSYKETFEEIVRFINNSNQSHPQEINEIPSAVLVMGVNMPDHSHIFQLLEQQLHKNNIFGTVILESKKCYNFTSLLSQMVSGIISQFQKQLGLEYLSLKKVEHTFCHLFSYFENIPDTYIGSPTKKAKLSRSLNSNLKSKPIVFLIQDVEAFNSEVLQELVLNCNLYSDRLPIVLVFGMASAMVTLHNILPQKALCCLGIETFYSLTATEYLTKIIDEVVISTEQPFKLGPKVFKLLIDTVLYHDFSISNITQLLKFCMIEHFYCNKVAILCCESSEFQKSVKNINSTDLQFFITLPSFQDHIEKNPDLAPLIKNENKCKDIIIECLNALYYHQRVMIVLLRCLHPLIDDLPGYPLGKQFRELYSMALEKEIIMSSGFEKAVKLLRMLSRNELTVKLKLCLENLNLYNQDLSNSILNEAKEKLKDYVKILSLMGSDEHETEAPELQPLDGEKIISRFQLQERIRMLIKMKRSKYDVYRSEIIDYLFELFKNIHPPSQLPLHEIFYFNNVASIRKHLMTVPRVTAHQALINPYKYLKCSCCKTKGTGEINTSMPDICVLYKLHLESGKLINLYDWLESFKSIKEVECGTKRRNTVSKDNVSNINIRFMQAVAELQLLGFIKKTKRKTDHVARLTFSNFS